MSLSSSKYIPPVNVRLDIHRAETITTTTVDIVTRGNFAVVHRKVRQRTSELSEAEGARERSTDDSRFIVEHSYVAEMMTLHGRDPVWALDIPSERTYKVMTPQFAALYRRGRWWGNPDRDHWEPEAKYEEVMAEPSNHVRVVRDTLRETAYVTSSQGKALWRGLFVPALPGSFDCKTYDLDALHRVLSHRAEVAELVRAQVPWYCRHYEGQTCIGFLYYPTIEVFPKLACLGHRFQEQLGVISSIMDLDNYRLAS